MDWRELQNKVALKQAGNDVNPIEPEETPSWLVGWDPNSENAQQDYDRRLLANIAAGNTLENRYSSIQQGAYQQAANAEALAKLANQTDYGAVRGDTDIPFEDWIKNPVDYRANSQSPAEKILNGAAKMLVTAGTTYLDNTAGLVAGLLGIRDDLFDDNPVLSRINDPFQMRERREGFHPLNAFIDTPFAQYMQQARDWSERFFPNYRTQEELDESDQWWKHMNANFWGDTVIKNLGFTIGAGVAGAQFAKGFNVSRGKIADKAYKAALAASEGDAEAEAAFRQVMQGGRAQSAKRMFDVFDDVQDSFKRLDLTSKIIGGFGGAMGESRTEALMAAKEFREDRTQNNIERYNKSHEKLIETIAGNPDFIDPETGQVNELGLQYYEDRLLELQADYQKAQSEIERQATKLANTTFGLNMPVLTASNAVMFGKLFSGGYKTQAKNLVKGTLGNYKPKGSIAKGVLKGLGNATVEGMEELTQKMISEGSKSFGIKNMASFHNKQYDKDAMRSVSEWLMDALDSTGNVLLDPKSWEEFAVGFLTGALGSASHFGFSKWSGGMLGGIQDGLHERNESRRLAEKLNEVSKSEQLQNLFSGLVRHKTLENMQIDDMVSGNKFAWHTHKDEQLINDVMMFADAGRLEDLESFVDGLVNADQNDIRNIKSLLSDETDERFGDKRPEELKKWLAERGRDVKKTINQYRNFYNTIDFLSFGTTDKEAIKELIYTESQLDNFENRYNEILDGVLAKVRPELEDAARETKQDGTKTEKAKRAERLLSSGEDLRRLFGGLSIDIKARAQDGNEQAQFFRMIDEAKQQKVLEDLEELGVFAKDKITKEEVRDLQSLVMARGEFYAKLFDPKGRRSFRDGFQEDEITPEAAAQDLEKDAREQAVSDAVSKLENARNFGDFVNIYNSIPGFDDEGNYMFGQALGTNPRIKDRWKKLNDTTSMMKDIDDVVSERMDSVSPENVGALQSVIDALSHLDLVSLFENADDNVDSLQVLRQAILDSVSGDAKAEQMARGILEEVLGDKAQAYGFGTIPGSGGGSEPGGGGGGGGASTKEQLIKDIKEQISSTKDKNSTVLNKLAVGDFSDYPADTFTDQEKAELSALAQSKLDELKARDGDGGGSDDVPTQVADDRDPLAVERSRKFFVAMDTKSLNGSKITVYDPTYLRKGIAKVYDGGKPGTKATIAWFRRHNVQDFIDTGALAKLEREYEKRHNKEKLPIYFIANPHYVENNLDTNPFVVKSNTKYKVAPDMLLAVEMNDENREILRDYEENGVFSDKTLITVTEGNKTTQYQVIGQVWQPSPSEVSSKGEDAEKYQQVREESQKVWEHVIGKSILPHYQSDLEKTKRSGNTFPDEGKWYVARIHPESAMQETDVQSADWTMGKRVHTTLNYIMSGRNEVKNLGDTEYTKIPLANSLPEYMGYGGKYYFRLAVRNPDMQRMAQTAGAPQFPHSINAPLGSLWIATTEANGAWSWNYVSIARTDEFDFAANSDKALVKRIDKAIDLILAPPTTGASASERTRDFEKRLQGTRTLRDIFYIGEGNTIQLDFASGPAVVIGGAYCRTKEDVYQALAVGKYRFQVKVETLNDMDRMDELIDAGVLLSEMRSFVRKGASIGVNFLEDTNADGETVDVHPRTSTEDIARTAGESVTNVYTFAENGSVDNVRIGDAGFYLSPDGKVYRMSSRLRRGDEVTDNILIAEVKAIAELMSFEGQNVPYPGSKWVIQDKYQYTELYERILNGIKVHIKKEGKNGTYQLVFSDEIWDSYMEAGIAKPSGPQFTRPEPKEGKDDLTDDELMRLYDEDAAKREGGKPVEQAPQTGRGRRGGAIGGQIVGRKVQRRGKTVQEASKEKIRKDSEERC